MQGQAQLQALLHIETKLSRQAVGFEDIFLQDNDRHLGDEQAHAEFPTNVGTDEDEAAFALLQTMHRGLSNELAQSIELNTLVHFINLSERYRRHLGDAARQQATAWASRTNAPEAFTGDAILCLWIM